MLSGAPDEPYWGHAAYVLRNVTHEEAMDSGANWLAEEYRKVLPDVEPFGYRVLHGGDGPVGFCLERTKQPSRVNAWYVKTFKCNLHKKRGCRVRYRLSVYAVGSSTSVLSTMHKHGTHTHDGAHHCAGLSPTIRTLLRAARSHGVTTPTDLLKSLVAHKVPSEQMPSTNQLRNFETASKKRAEADGKAGVLAGLVHQLHYNNYHAMKARLSGVGWQYSQAYVIPGTDCEQLRSDNMLLVFATDSGIRDLALSCKHLHGGWIGIDGKHRTNYASYPLIPVVGKDVNDKYFLVALMLVSSEHGDRIGAGLRLILSWALRRFPGECDGLEQIQPMSPSAVNSREDCRGNGGLAARDDNSDDGSIVDADGEQGDSDDEFDPVLREADFERVPSRRLRLAKRRKWEGKMNGYIDWGAFSVGYSTSLLIGHRGRRGRTTPKFLRIQWGGADNADNYAAALAYAAYCIVCNCCVHLLINNICKRGATLFVALGGDSPNSIRAQVLALLKLLRDIPSLRLDSQVVRAIPWRDTAMFDVGCALLVREMKDAGFANAAEALYNEYLSSPRKCRWGGAHFPEFIPNHQAGPESLNARAAADCAKHKNVNVTEFADRARGWMTQRAERRKMPGEGFSTSIDRIEKDTAMWRKVNRLVNEKNRSRGSKFISDMVCVVQMHEGLKPFYRATTERYSIPSSQLLTYYLDEQMGRTRQTVRAMAPLRQRYMDLVRDPEEYVDTYQPSINQYLRLTTRSFYVLERLQPEDVRSEFCVYSCTCPAYRRRSYCKHAVALGVIKGLVAVPRHLDYTILSRLNTKGRKRLPFTRCDLRSFGQDATIMGVQASDGNEADHTQGNDSGSGGDDEEDDEEDDE